MMQLKAPHLFLISNYYQNCGAWEYSGSRLPETSIDLQNQSILEEKTHPASQPQTTNTDKTPEQALEPNCKERKIKKLHGEM